MKKVILIAAVMLGSVAACAMSTTYQFTSLKWASKVGSVACDGTSDGWKAEANGEGYSAGTVYPSDQMLHNAGIQVTEALSGKKVTSVIDFQNVRKVIVNYYVSSSGNGDITIAVGDTTMSKTVNKAMKTNQDYSLNEDVEFVLHNERSGKVVLSVENITKSSVYINTITIKADNGSGDVFSTKVYHLVTDKAQLKDSDLIMIGVADGTTNKALGYYDADVSKNNIHAVNAKYDAMREYINSNEEVTYLLNTAVAPKSGTASFTIMDPYVEAYLVASGGQTKNKLTIWDKAYDEKSFGEYGYWDIQIAADGKATIKSLGSSLGKYIQYNASDVLFGCYAAETMTAVSIYRQEEAKDLTQPMIVAPMVNFGTGVIRGGTELTGSKTIEVKANKLTTDISVSLKQGTAFSLNTSTLDRDGDKLTITYKVSAVGKYSDVLVLTSGTVTEEVPVMLDVMREVTVAEAVTSGDFEYVYLNQVVVTKKNDRSVYVRDATGSMLLYDKGPDSDRYAKDLETGHVLNGVEGKFQNYYGVPELHMMAKPSREAQKVECLPEQMTVCADSADVCRYVVFEDVNISKSGSYELEIGGKKLPLKETWVLPKESMSLVAAVGKKCDVAGIVSYDYDVTVLYPTMVSLHETTGLTDERMNGLTDEGMNGQFRLQMLPDGRIVIRNNSTIYDIVGREVSLP